MKDTHNLQSNYDLGINPGDGTKSTTRIQPVAPFNLNQNRNLLSRTILHVIDKHGILPSRAADEFGFRDTVRFYGGLRYYLTSLTTVPSGACVSV